MSIELKHCSRIYTKGSHQVIANDDLSLTIPTGSFTTIVGKSGSGKSTLLHLLGGLDRPTSGDILFGGKSIVNLSNKALAQHRRHTIGIIFQSFNLIFSKSALDNVILPLRFADVSKKERMEKAKQALTDTGLAHRMMHLANELSGGEAQRVAIARALVNDPSVLLADEPTGNLDSNTAEEILNLLKQMHARGKTIVMITHDNDMAQAVSQHIVTMKDGKIIKEESCA